MKTIINKIFLVSLFILLLLITGVLTTKAYGCTLNGHPFGGYSVADMCLEIDVDVTARNLPNGKDLFIGCNGDGGNGLVINKHYDSTDEVCRGQYCDGSFGGANGTNWCQGERKRIINNNGNATQNGSANLTHCSCTAGNNCIRFAIASSRPTISDACGANPIVDFSGKTPGDLGCTVDKTQGAACGTNGNTISPNYTITCPAPTCTPSTYCPPNACGGGFDDLCGGVHPCGTCPTGQTCNNSGGGQGRCVTPTPAPTCSLTVNPTSITSGGTSTLSWSTTNGSDFIINPTFGDVTPVAAGSRSVNPTVTTTYTGSVTGPGGNNTCTVSLGVTAPPVSCNYTTYWGSCSATCGGGNQSQYYTITSPAQNGGSCSVYQDQPTGASRSCNTQGCPVSCSYTTYWGSCSATCGGGTQSQYYTITSPAQNGGSCSVYQGQATGASQACSGTAIVNGGWSAFGTCSAVCGPGTQTRTCTNPAPNSCGTACSGSTSQDCAPTCPAGQSCQSNACVCNAVGTPASLAPSGTLAGSQTLNITWGAVAGAANYALRVDDLSTPWSNDCGITQYGGDICNNNVTGTSYSYAFQAGHSYSIWVHSVSACGAYSAAAATSVNVTSTVNIHVYNDNNGNGAQDVGEIGANGKTVTVTGGGASGSPYTTDANGNIQITNLLPGSSPSTATVTVPSGWSATTSNPASASYPPSPAQLNFGIKPPAPRCSGGLTANPTSVNPGQTSALTAVGCTSPTGQILNYTYYDDSTIAGDSVTNNNTNTSTWTSPNPYWTAVTAHPSVAVCNQGGVGALCTNYGTNINIVPLYSITGNVFEDVNKDKLKNGGDTNYVGAIIVTSSNGSAAIYPVSGQYKISNLPAGPYTITYQGPPNGYKMTYPQVVPVAFTVIVGAGCSGGGSNSATCVSGNIDNLNFGIIYGNPWIQTGSDVFFNNGVTNQIPTTASCNGNGPVMSVSPNGSPGVIYSGANNPDFGNGQASNPKNWKVGGSPGNYPESYTPKSSGIKTSYAYVSGILAQNGTVGTDLATVGGCSVAGTSVTCDTSAWTSLANGVYKTSGNLTLQGSGYNFPGGKNYVFLVKEVLNINEKIHVPVGSTVLFSVSGNINVAATVGSAATSYPVIGAADLEGWYSTDKSFIVLGSHNCNTTADLRLNVQGSIIVNASGNGGTFDYSGRDLCTNNLACPVFYIEQRPDFVLNAPRFLLTAPRIWQEVAP